MSRIAVTGPESTGKTILSKELASYYKCSWIEEYAREYLETLDRAYTFDDVTAIAKGQLALINNSLKDNDCIVSDTELVVTKIWQEVRFGHCDLWIENNIDTQPFDLYLLCAPDIPWEYDPLREHPEMREILFEKYHEELSKRNLPFAVVKGIGPQRLKMALDEISGRRLLFYFSESY